MNELPRLGPPQPVVRDSLSSRFKLVDKNAPFVVVTFLYRSRGGEFQSIVG